MPLGFIWVDLILGNIFTKLEISPSCLEGTHAITEAKLMNRFRELWTQLQSQVILPDHEEKLDDIDEKSDDELLNVGKKRKNSSKMNNSVTSQKKKRKEKPVLTRKIEEAAIKVTKKEKPFVEYSKSKKKDKIIQNEDMDESNTDKAKENIGAKLSSSQMNKSNQRNNARRVIKIIIKKSASHIKR
jgi:hypothetical protein